MTPKYQQLGIRTPTVKLYVRTEICILIFDRSFMKKGVCKSHLICQISANTSNC